MTHPVRMQSRLCLIFSNPSIQLKRLYSPPKHTQIFLLRFRLLSTAIIRLKRVQRLQTCVLSTLSPCCYPPRSYLSACRSCCLWLLLSFPNTVPWSEWYKLWQYLFDNSRHQDNRHIALLVQWLKDNRAYEPLALSGTYLHHRKYNQCP